MEVILITSPATQKIVPASRWLWHKYTPFDPKFVMHEGPLSEWCKTASEAVEKVKDEYVIFGVDDLLVIDYWKQELYDRVKSEWDFDRLEFGVDPWEKRRDNMEFWTKKKGGIAIYGENDPYWSSCQLSAWRTVTLFHLLRWVNSTPWEFEHRGTEILKEMEYIILCTRDKYILRSIEESALAKPGRSPKRPDGSVNVLGLRHEDRNELISKGFLKEEELVYGLRSGSKEFTYEGLEYKYKEFYE